MVDPTEHFDERTQDLPEDVLADIRASSSRDLEEVGMVPNDTQTLNIIDSVLNQVRDAVRSTGVVEDEVEDDDQMFYDEPVDVADDRVRIGSGSRTRIPPVDDYQPLTERRPSGSVAKDASRSGGGVSERTVVDLQYVTELARRHGVAEAKYEAVSRRLGDHERALGQERLALADNLFAIMMDLQGAADRGQSSGSLQRALGQVEQVYGRLSEQTRELRVVDDRERGSGSRRVGTASVFNREESSGERSAHIGSTSRRMAVSSTRMPVQPWAESPTGHIYHSSGRRRAVATALWRRRLLRVAIALAVVVGLLVWLLRASYFPASSSALVDAPLLEIRTGISGVLEPTAFHLGDPIDAGSLLFAVRNDRVDTAHLDGQVQHRELLRERIDRLEADRAEATRVRAALDADLIAYRERLLERLQGQLAEQEAQLDQTEAALAVQREVLLELEQRADEFADSDQRREVDRVVVALDLKHKAQAALLRRIQGRYDDAVAGHYQEVDRPPQLVRIEDADRQLSEIEQDLREATDELIARDERIAAAQAVIDRLRYEEVHAPIEGVVWRRFAEDGEQVAEQKRVVQLANARRSTVFAWLPAEDA
ncbi:MAG: HlyD family secretion protein, partial [Planctomycetota bacterium]